MPESEPTVHEAKVPFGTADESEPNSDLKRVPFGTMNQSEPNYDEGKVLFEVAIARTGFGLYSYSLVALTGLFMFSYSCIAFSGTMIVPTSACELNTTLTEQGILAAFPMVGSIVGAIMWGYLGDMLGRRRMLLVSLLSAGTCNALASISVNWIMLLVLQFIGCFLASGLYSLSMTLLSESVPAVRRNLVMLLVISVSVLAQGIMALIAIPIIPLPFSNYLPALDIFWNSWRTLLVVYSIPCFISALWLFFMKESPRYVFVKGDEAGAIEILRSIHRLNNRNSQEELQVKGLLKDPSKLTGPARKRDQIVPLFKPPLVKYTIIMTSLGILLQITSFIVWLPRIANQFVTILQTGEGSDLTLCGIIAKSIDAPPDSDAVPCSLNETALLIVFGIGIIQAVLNGSISLFVNRTGRRNTAMVVTIVCGGSGIILNFVNSAVGSAVLFTVFLTGMLASGLYTTMTVALFPTHLRALAVSLTMQGGPITTFFVIQIVNQLLETNCELAFYIFGSLFAASSLVLALLPDDRLLLRPQTPQQIKEETQEIEST